MYVVVASLFMHSLANLFAHVMGGRVRIGVTRCGVRYDELDPNPPPDPTLPPYHPPPTSLGNPRRCPRLPGDVVMIARPQNTE